MSSQLALISCLLMLVPVPPRLNEWAYARFAIDIASAVIAHLSVGDGPQAWSWAIATGVLWALLLATPGNLELNMKKSVRVEFASALIDEKIKERGDWRGKTLAKVRGIVHDADPEIVEEW
ncbi:MAG: hypothetical protein JWO13_394 [Acidobacteriales bacterium]|nr:hypothetical protein [Terriglobales bacterium]